MVVEKYYTIKVGVSEPQEVEVGRVSKITGLPEGPTEKAYSVLGAVAIPNYSKVWAKRALDKEKKPTGDLTFLPWGHAEGEVVEVRYLANCKSIDKLYQDKVGLKMGEQDGEIIFSTGLNNYIQQTEAPLIQMLKVHTYNGSSPCRNPKNNKIVFEDYDEEKMINSGLKESEILFDSMQVLMSIKDNSKKLSVFAHLFDIDSSFQDNVILNELLKISKGQPLRFLERIDKFKDEAQSAISKANGLEILNLESVGEVVLTVDGNKSIVTGLNTQLTGESKLDYMVSNCTDPEVYDAIRAIKSAIIKRERQLN